MPTVTVDEARSELSRLIDRALAGEEILIVREGCPLVRLAPLGEWPP